MKFPFYLPFLVGLGMSAVLAYFDWIGFWFIFAPVGLAISTGMYISSYLKPKDINLGRKISLTIIALDLIIFLGFMQRENLQLEETVFYFSYFLTTLTFTRVLIHYAVAKVGGPLIFGRAYCAWGCYTAALLEWLPIKENKRIKKKYTYIRFLVLIISILIPLFFILFGYDYITKHIYGPSFGYDDFPFQFHKYDQFIWFLVSNAIYYVTAVILAFVFKKKRAFCKIACPVSLVMKIPSKVSLLKIRPQMDKTCIECGKCTEICPMDVDVMSYIKNKKPVTSTECILCGNCMRVCPVGAIVRFDNDSTGKELVGSSAGNIAK